MDDTEVVRRVAGAMTAKLHSDRDTFIALLASIPPDQQPKAVVTLATALTVTIGLAARAVNLPPQELWQEILMVGYKENLFETKKPSQGTT